MEWVLGPSTGLEGLKIGHAIILHRLLILGNLGTKLVTSARQVTVNDEDEQKEGECFQLPWYGGTKGYGWAMLALWVASYQWTCPTPFFSSFCPDTAFPLSQPSPKHSFLNSPPSELGGGYP